MARLVITMAPLKPGEAPTTLDLDLDADTALDRADFLRRLMRQWRSPWVTVRDSGGGEVCQVASPVGNHQHCPAQRKRTLLMKPLSLTIAELRGGDADVECGRKLAEVIAAVKALRKPGSITIKIDVEAADKEGASPRIMLTDSVKTSVPPANPAP